MSNKSKVKFEITDGLIEEFSMEVMEGVKKSLAAGRREYGTTFDSDPLKKLWEEILDSAFYCFVAIRDRDKKAESEKELELKEL